MMLRGQSTLSRLVGKRRRLPPDKPPLTNADPNDCLTGGEAHFSLIQTDLVEAFPSVNQNDYSYGLCKQPLISQDMFLGFNGGDMEKENLPVSWVQCPICQKDIKGDNGYINIHIDLCLLEENNHNNHKATKPKMHVELNNLSLKYAEHQSSSSLGSDEYRENSTFTEGLPGVNVMANKNNGGQPASLKILSDKDHFDLPMHCDCNCACHGKEDIVLCDADKTISLKSISELNEIHNSAEPSQDRRMAVDIKSFTEENRTNKVHVLETCVVGRRFNRHVKVEENMEIQVLREPENPKDSNAIKIVGPSSQGNLTLGHLPRNLASCLSCLLDNGHIYIKGFVTGVPNKAFEPVLVTLLCEETREKRSEILDSFEKTWQRALEFAKPIVQKQENVNQGSSKYVNNFTYLLNVVLQRDSHLFSERELELLGSFLSLTEDAQCLFIRLSQRKGPWFRVSQINYEEILDVEQACQELAASGFFSFGGSLEKEEGFEKALRERLHMLSVPELKQILLRVNLKHKKPDSRTMRRDNLVACVVLAAKEKHQDLHAETASEEMTIVSHISEAIGRCVCVSDVANLLLWRLQRLFFLNGEQDLSSFLLVEMGTIKYPAYVCCQTQKAFIDREALLAYEQALEVAQAMDMAVETNDMKSIDRCIAIASSQLAPKEGVQLCRETQDVFLHRFTCKWVFATIVTVAVSVLERERRYVEAVQYLRQLLSQSCCPGRRGYWTVRLSLDLEHLGYKEESLSVAEDGLKDSRIRHGDRVALQRRVLRLGKPPRRWKKPSFANSLSKSCNEVKIIGRPLNCEIGMRSRFYGYDNDQCTVEELALQHYASDSGGRWQGVHSEGGIWMTLFALLMWDVLFANVPNVFWHAFQSGPLDLNTDAFYFAREPLIEAQLRKIQSGAVPQLIATTWSKWFGTICRGLNWERFSLQEIQIMASCVGGHGLASICRLLAEDYAGLSGGMPDLFLWRVSDSGVGCASCVDECPKSYSSIGGEAKLVEVKGPRDRLSEQQRAWISTLMNAGIDVEVCKVLEQPRARDHHQADDG